MAMWGQVREEDNRPVVSSRKVAEVFEKEHKIVMRDIRELGCAAEFAAYNFVCGSYKDAQNQERPEYLMTRLGFSVLTMGFTDTKGELPQFKPLRLRVRQRDYNINSVGTLDN